MTGAAGRATPSILLALFLTACTVVDAESAAATPETGTSFEGARLWVVLGLVALFVFLGWLAGRIRRPNPPTGSETDQGHG